MAEAETACRRLLAANPKDGAALQILAMTQHRRGQYPDAEATFRRSVEIAPRNAEFRTNFALLLAAAARTEESIAQLERALVLDPRFRPARLALARICNQAGSYEAADAHSRKLLAADERDSEAWSALGTARFALKRTSDARAAFERAVALAPYYGAARYGLAAALCEEERSEDALEQTDEAVRLGVDHRELLLTRARVLVQLDRYDESEAVLGSLLRSQHHDLDAHLLLAQLRKIRGDADCARSLRAAAERHDAPPAIRAAYADVTRRLGDLRLAEQLLRNEIAQNGVTPHTLSLLAMVLHEDGRPGEAVGAAREAARADPVDPDIAENLVAALLSAGEPREARTTIDRFRASAPDDQRWITYRADAARQCGESLFEEWCDWMRFVRVYDLPAPRGYATMERFNEELRAVLQARHAQASHPLDQSMRGGTQTSRGLITGMSPVIDSFLEALQKPIADYQSALGSDPLHPFLRRNTAAARIAGCWSVRLKRGGFHVNHIHPRGWLSSAYYVAVPLETGDVSARSGWIKFGEPRFAQPRAESRHFIQPVAGRLVLFPSYMWHGTVPLQGDEPRLTVAFDAVPETRPGSSRR